MKRIFIIGEIGINHNGDINIAKKLIDLAKKAGADAVKFQKRDIELVYSKKLLDSPRESPWGKTQRDQKLGLEFNYEEYNIIDNYCKQNEITWFASAWDINSLKFLEKFNLNFNKIASAMIIDKNFLKAVAKQKKHTFISTGMSTEKDIDDAVKIFREMNCPFELMHCISTYPMDPKDANLSTITELKKKYKCDVGYSGHESGVAVSLGAAALGISSLERHITLDRAMYGSDQAASIEHGVLKNFVDSVKAVKKILGNGEKKVIDSEIPIRKKLRLNIR